MDHSRESSHSLIGKIKIGVFEATLRLRSGNQQSSAYTPSLDTTISTDHALAKNQKLRTKLKYVRSSTGANFQTLGHDNSTMSFSRVRQVNEFVLHYATVPGLIRIGVLPSPTASTSSDIVAEIDPILATSGKQCRAMVTPFREDPSNAHKRQQKSHAVRKLNFIDLTQDD